MRNREAGWLKVRSLTEVKSALIVSYFMLFLSGCATIQGVQGARFEFALLGDVPYDVFVKEILQKQRIGPSAFERFVRHDLGVHQLLQVAGLSGKLVPQHEAEAF